MRYNQLGNSGLFVSELCLGTMTFGTGAGFWKNIGQVGVAEAEKLIARVKPSVLVKGSDYTREEVVGRDIVEALGGEIILIDIVPGHSTTSVVERTRVKAGSSSRA
jgi:hypothetical protein